MSTFILSHEMDSINKTYDEGLASQFKLKKCDSTVQICALGKICKDNMGFRMSVSDYAYSSNSYLFGMLYMMASMLYIYNGFVYMRRKDFLSIQRKGSVANIIIGIFLIGVILNP